MERFAALFLTLDRTRRSSEKLAALVAYLRGAPPADAAWAVQLLSGERPKRIMPARELAALASSLAGIPLWLFEESYGVVGDLAETIALVVPDSDASHHAAPALHDLIERALLPLSALNEEERRARVTSTWRVLSPAQRFLYVKLLTGEFRVGVARQTVVKALASIASVSDEVMAHRLGGAWHPQREGALDTLLRAGDEASPDEDPSHPYPFFLAYPLEQTTDALGDVADWQVEWKWDGIRAQLIVRAGEVFIWTRGGERVTERYPEVAEAARRLPDGTVLDGELLAWRGNTPLAFSAMQKRIGRVTPSKRTLAETPVRLMVFDLLERGGHDLRSRSLAERRAQLTAILDVGRDETSDEDAAAGIHLSPALSVSSWADVAALRRGARQQGTEGVMLKRLSSTYGVGRRRSEWWKWKVDAMSVDAVLVYAQAGHGRRAALHTDYTFALWHDGALLPFAKAYSGLTDEELLEMDGWIRRHTLERFGPVRRVDPVHVFEVAFEGIQRSPRHKSGVAVRFPRILRWRKDKTADQADELARLHALIDAT